MHSIRRFLRRLEPIEPWLYALWAGALTLACALRFYGSLRLQTTFADLYRDPSGLESAYQGGLGPWSAPLDDVFIHFDFARQAARGHPFEWSPGNGYSSGGTSLLYPLVLAVGYALHFSGLRLMHFAAIVATVSVFGTLLALRRLFVRLPRSTSYFLPPVLFAVGALDWSFWSGMEVALFVGLWSLALVAWDDLASASPASLGRASSFIAPAALLGLAALLVVATRPEGIVAVAVLCGSLLWLRRDLGVKRLCALCVLAGAPSLAVLVGQALANRLLTGDSTAAGGLVKLELHHPFMPRAEVIAAFWFHFKYQVLRVTNYHFADLPGFGFIPWLFGAYALVSAKTRRQAAVLWLSYFGWVAIVSLNGQVRWQNERYTMPAVAWLLMSAALGLAALFAHARAQKPRSWAPGAIALVLSGLFVWRQLPRFREQVWFFGRAARNIYDQHVQTGLLLRDGLDPPAKRVLVGDAGAIPYVSNLPALDIIGLGGYHDLPFARATRINVAAGIELLERLRVSERPDLLALYPSWWGDFPLWFGTRLGEVPVRGNVICGGPSKVIYRAHWEALDDSEEPFSLGPTERRVDGIDFADLVSEAAHGYARSDRYGGHVFMKLLENPSDRRKDLWDAARIGTPGAPERFTLSGLDPEQPVQLILRTAPTETTPLSISVKGGPKRRIELSATDGWLETHVDLGRIDQSTIEVEIDSERVGRALFHIWAVQK